MLLGRELDVELDLSEVPLAPGARLFRVNAPWPLRSDVSGLDLPDEPKRALLALTPATYTGRAESLAKTV